jgi:hypothetical protein
MTIVNDACYIRKLEKNHVVDEFIIYLEQTLLTILIPLPHAFTCFILSSIHILEGFKSPSHHILVNFGLLKLGKLILKQIQLKMDTLEFLGGGFWG